MEEKNRHSFISEGRENIRLDGVEEVISFDDSEISLRTLCGGMTVEGEGLHIGVLNVEQGHVEVSGRIDGLFYFDDTQNQKKKLFGRR